MYIHDDKKPGWPNNVGTKPAAVTNFDEIMKASACELRSENLVEEARNYRWLKKRGTGSMGASGNGHDDELITAIMAMVPTVREQAMVVRQGRRKEAQQEMVSLW